MAGPAHTLPRIMYCRTKRNANQWPKGHTISWIGYKLQIDTAPLHLHQPHHDLGVDA